MDQAPDIQKLLKKFVKNDCTQEDIETIINYVKQAEGTDDLPNFTEVLQQFEEIPDMEQQRAQKMYHDILTTAKRKKPTVPTKKVWRYTAAILIIALTSTYLLRNNILNNIASPVPTIVNSTIQSGTDKATLTLETGEIVTLVKGTTYQTPNATSNGEEIVYNTINSNSSELVYNYLSVPRGGQFALKLSDGTKIWLNSESLLKYPVSFTEGESRQVELVYGEAYFDVSPSTAHKGSNFKVFNKNQQVEVLGTKFNIKAYKDEILVYTTLVEGKVDVKTSAQNKILKPNQQSTINITNGNMEIANINVRGEVAWINGEFILQRKNLREIMKVLSRWYDMDVVFANKELENVRFVGVLGKDQNIVDILDTIKSFGVINDYEINNKKVILK